MNFDHLVQCQVPSEVKCTHYLPDPSDDAWLQMFPSCLRREQGSFAANDALFWLKETSPCPSHSLCRWSSARLQTLDIRSSMCALISVAERLSFRAINRSRTSFNGPFFARLYTSHLSCKVA